jgi:serine/threonine-protein kinase
MSRRQLVGRYALGPVIGEGGTAVVYVGRLLGPDGFARTVAIKRLRTDRDDDAGDTHDLLDEARIASRVSHPNVVGVIDVVKEDGVHWLVMDYVHGETLGRVLSMSKVPIPPAIAAAILRDVLRGLAAAHDAKDAHGAPLHIVHRDVSTRNVLIGADGVARIADFGVAKAVGSTVRTATGTIRGTIRFMSPEQFRGGGLTAQADLFSAGAVLWEMLAGRALFAADSDAQTIYAILERPVEPPSHVASDVPIKLDEVVLRSLERAPSARFLTATDMAAALERAVAPASSQQVAEWLEDLCGSAMTERLEVVRALEREPAETRQPRRRYALLAAILAIPALGVISAGARSRHAPEPEPATRASAGPPATGVVTVAAPPVTVAPIMSSAIVSMPVTTSTSTNASSPKRARPVASGKKRECDPPYRVNADGITVFKEECL